MLEFLVRQAEIVAKELGSGSGLDPHAIARRDLVHALLSHNDFLTVH
jgi:hypothetical protein